MRRFNLKKNPFIPLLALLCAFFFGGCYTQLMSYQGETMHSGRSSNLYAGDCADGGCPQEVPPNRREVCVWERDIFGFPDLRCYNTNYSSAWIYFHNTPWWYRDTYGWHDYRGCPPYYYYDRIAGICRYHDHRHPHPPRPNPGRPDGRDDQPPPRRNTRGTPQHGQDPSVHAAPSEPAPTGFIPPATGGGIRQLSPVASPTRPLPPPDQNTGDQMTKPLDGSDSPPPDQNRDRDRDQQGEPSRPRDNTPANPPSRRNTRGM
ncbi:MAG: hypothetical protein LBC70_03780 [Chitinispirillales bacterium]|jgi:hypothetical protein|nr:hypothetical protein [Chitinispirillales bacterium]